MRHSSRIFTLLFIGVCLLSGIHYAQIPPGYYDPANGKTGVALQAALHGIIKDHTVVAYGDITDYFPLTDAKPGNVVWDMYSDVPGGTPPYVYHYNAGDECGNYNNEGDCFNREHSWPKSWFNDLAPAYSDMFHIYPTDGWVNGKRSNYPYGRVGSATWTSLNGCKLGNCTWPGYTGVVFEPLNEYKGDFARTYFYMSTRYYTEDNGWNVTDMTNKSQLKPWALQMMLHWHLTDPVSAKETSRNNALYAIQDNRNPFIDHPEYATMIWGYPVGQDEMNTPETNLSVIPNPATTTCLISLPEGSHSTLTWCGVFDISGRILPVAAESGLKQIRLDVSGLSSGFYFLMASDDLGNRYITRFRKQ